MNYLEKLQQHRINAAQAAVDAFTAHDTKQYANEDLATRIGDLIADLAHLADARSDMSGSALLDRGHGHYEAELEENAEEEEVE